MPDVPSPRVPAILIDAERIASRVAEIGLAVRQDVGPEVPLHVVAVLKGAFMFLADLVRALPGPVTCDFIAVSSYGAGVSSSGEVRLTKDLDTPLADRDVLLVEDIVDTGITLAYLQELVRARAPRSLRTACLLDKPSRRRVAVPVEYVGFTIPDVFVVGYGLDEAERHRNLPWIGVFDHGGVAS